MIFNAFERMVASRYLRARRQEGFVSVIAGFSFLGIMLGVATLIIVMSVMNGFRTELMTRVLGLNGHMNVMSFERSLADYDEIADDVRTASHVTHVFPLIEGQALLNVRGAATGAIVRGMRTDDLARKPVLSERLENGGWDNLDDDQVAIGIRMAERYGLRVGDELTLVSPQGRDGPFGTVPRTASFEIGAVFDVGMYEYDSSLIFMSLDLAQRFFQLQDSVTSLEVLLSNPDLLAEARPSVQSLAGPDTRIVDWQQANSSLFNALQVERNVMFLILTLIIVVAAFNIISSMIMLVKDKGRDIAILRTMGATRGMIMRVFLLTGASIGVIGTIVGTILGVLFAHNVETIRSWLENLVGAELFAAEIYFLSRLPSEINWSEVGWVVGMALGLSFLATLYPSWRASRLDPVEALRYE